MNDKAVNCVGNYNNFNSSNCIKSKTYSYKPRTLKKVIPSKSFIQRCSGDRKGCSTGTISHLDKKSVGKPKVTTKSDQTFNKNAPKKIVKPDLCKQCGDVDEKVKGGTKQLEVNELSDHSKTPIACDGNTKFHKNTSKHQMEKICSRSANNEGYNHTVQQYYKNENFALSSESVHVTPSKNKRKPPLSTIIESSEVSISEGNTSKAVLYEIYPESNDEEVGYFDVNRWDNIKEIKEFRQRNYFECHSAKSRIKVKDDTSILGEHKCLYRFYLNDRLFPVPLSTDYHNNIRCIECKLPLEEATKINKPNSQNSINGTVQAKIKLNDKVQDMILMLPVKEPLIIKEKRKEMQNIVDPEVLYFGIIKLNSTGDSVFRSTCPTNSLALKYQKGYRELVNNEVYKYECVNEGDVIII
ncbi:unnamed protein product [Parnassius apollo]|uniref:(apollo) hypothetical protein n=1 Tax=Parnassius apollo TaxID=110799 RepID=A0A8S3XY17_PARAO|nr:unnamed protein product [Parnassius apollo]